jgi:hypothetical protein
MQKNMLYIVRDDYFFKIAATKECKPVDNADAVGDNHL